MTFMRLPNFHLLRVFLPRRTCNQERPACIVAMEVRHGIVFRARLTAPRLHTARVLGCEYSRVIACERTGGWPPAALKLLLTPAPSSCKRALSHRVRFNRTPTVSPMPAFRYSLLDLPSHSDFPVTTKIMPPASGTEPPKQCD
jgi:hypothetical protein